MCRGLCFHNEVKQKESNQTRHRNESGFFILSSFNFCRNSLKVELLLRNQKILIQFQFSAQNNIPVGILLFFDMLELFVTLIKRLDVCLQSRLGAFDSLM